MILKDEFATRLRTARRRTGLNQEQFGALGGVTLGSQSRFEKGQQKPGLEYLTGLAQSGIDVTYLLVGTEGDWPPIPEIAEAGQIIAELPEGLRPYGVAQLRTLLEEWKKQPRVDPKNGFLPSFTEKARQQNRRKPGG